MQGIIPRAINERVDELFVGEDKIHLAREEAERLESVEITKLDLEWLQVLSEGWASPLTGIFKSEYYNSLYLEFT